MKGEIIFRILLFAFLLFMLVAISAGCADGSQKVSTASEATTTTTRSIGREKRFSAGNSVDFFCNGIVGIYAENQGVAILLNDPNCLPK